MMLLLLLLLLLLVVVLLLLLLLLLQLQLAVASRAQSPPWAPPRHPDHYPQLSAPLAVCAPAQGGEHRLPDLLLERMAVLATASTASQSWSQPSTGMRPEERRCGPSVFATSFRQAALRRRWLLLPTVCWMVWHRSCSWT
jgi:hypothetical protein